MKTEAETVKEIINEMKRGNEIGKKLGYFPKEKQIRAISALDDSDDLIEITPEDTKFAAKESWNSGRIVISGEIVEKLARRTRQNDVHFDSWDDGDVYNLLQETPSPRAVQGTIHFGVDYQQAVPVSSVGKADDIVRVTILKYHPRPEDPYTHKPGPSIVMG